MGKNYTPLWVVLPVILWMAGKTTVPRSKIPSVPKGNFLKASSLVVDEAYIRESIEKPMAKTVKGYLTGMMPPYKLQEAEYDSLVLFIKSVR